MANMEDPGYLADDNKHENGRCDQRELRRQRLEKTQVTITETLGCMAKTVRRLISMTRPPPKFHSFSRLPHELQIMIWEAALPDPARVVGQRLKTGTFKFFFESDPAQNRYALRATCYLAREAALKHFSIRFMTPKHKTMYFHEKDSIEWIICLSRSLSGFHFGIGEYLEFLKFKLERRVDDVWVSESLLDCGVVRVNGQLFRKYYECMHRRV